ncbi:hypothetical protein [Yersinia mollaretii]|nr:hypothetical protein [Yersinia mollaretii]
MIAGKALAGLADVKIVVQIQYIQLVAISYNYNNKFNNTVFGGNLSGQTK